MNIRTETKSDRNAVLQLVEQAFATAEHSDGTEHLLVERLYRSCAFIPELALVAELKEEIVGYILFTKVRIGDSEQLALAPLAISPQFQKQGIGSALIKKGHQIAKQLGFAYVVVLGDPNYYAKFGYQSASRWQISAPFDAPSEYFMAIELSKPSQVVQGLVQYAAEFQL